MRDTTLGLIDSLLWKWIGSLVRLWAVVYSEWMFFGGALDVGEIGMLGFGWPIVNRIPTGGTARFYFFIRL